MAIIPKTREEKRVRRHLRVRKALAGTPERPRLVVFRSLKHIYAQLVDDTSRAHAARRCRATGSPRARRPSVRSQVGKAIAEKAKAAGISRVVFDRAGYKYHGRVKAVADGAREGGLEF